MRREVCVAVAALLAATPALSDVVINEIMYDSVESTDVEYVELYNTGPLAVDLAGWWIVDDNTAHDHCALAGTLPPGAYLVVPGFTDRFTAKYPGVTNLNPAQFDSATTGRGFSLGNGGDWVQLYDNLGALRDIVKYGNAAPWPAAAHGTGPSLELYHPALDNSLAASWGASTNAPPNGTPGAQNSVYRVDQPPQIDLVARSIALPTHADAVRITARVTDDKGLGGVKLYVDEGSGFVPRAMFDDGLHGDGLPADGTFGADLIAAHADGTVVRYYVSATDTLPQTSYNPVLAPAEWYGYTVGHVPAALVINELVPSNKTGITDEAGQHADWVELKNAGPVTVDLGGLFLSDSAGQSRKWRFPSPTPIDPGQRLVVWCDGDVAQGPLHAGFKLDKSGGTIALFDAVDLGNVPIHVLTYGPTAADVAFGFRPEGADAPEYLSTPTPYADNAASALFSPVVINEFLTTSAAGGVDDWIELYNRGPVAIDISGWNLSDDIKLPLTYSFPAGTVLPAGGRISVDETTLGFGLSSDGSEAILLTAPGGAIGQDYFDYGPQSPDVSQGRLGDGATNWHFFSTPSRDVPNDCGSSGIALGRVTGLRLARRASGIVDLAWTPVAGVGAYDVVRGDVRTMLMSGNFASADCLENNSGDAASWDGSLLSSSNATYYLVRATSAACDHGTYDDGTEAAPRDAGIAAAPAACP